ncbi:MAG: polysaccharide deacetylase family protein [Candidatus Saganbacteria bacterium]|nr:polysaccharide deacetylase family protein [Candidatus Saganbacteria bacterium]
MRPRLLIFSALFFTGILLSSCQKATGPSPLVVKGPYNELGRIFVVEYHRIEDGKGEWIRSAANFRKDLEKFYAEGFCLVSINDLFNNSRVKVPEGRKPLVMTFDDGHPTQFRFLIVKGSTVEGSGGIPKIDPDCAVGILDEFCRKHSDFGRAATFFINSRPFYQKECPSLWKEKLKYLVRTGREIGNHTLTHAKLSDLDFNGIKKEIALLQAKIYEAIPSHEASSVALPFGILPKRGRWLLQDGTYGGITYHYKVAFLVGWSPATPPFRTDFDPAMVQRIQASDVELDKWISYMKKHTREFYVSDGDPNTITFQQKDEKLLDKTALKAGMKIKIYDGDKFVKESRISSKKDRMNRIRTSDKGVYYTFHSAGIENRLDELIENYKKTGLNTVVIDLKDIEGVIGTPVEVPLAKKIGALDRIFIKDFKQVLKKMHDNGIRVSVRIAVFKDRLLAKKRPDLALKSKTGNVWTENDGVNWVDPFSEEVRKYNIDLAEAAAKMGADEVQFDYIRFPEKGSVSNIAVPRDKEKYYAVERFLKEAYERLEPYNVSIAIDIFGVMAWLKDMDISITGQRIGEMAKYVFVVSPMLYPSHFDRGFDGYQNPVDEPYLFIKRGCEKSLKLIEGADAKLVPWIQGFDWRVKNFSENYVLMQKKALDDLKIRSFLVWNAGNKYSITYSALRHFKN